jgi:hypothetical protein
MIDRLEDVIAGRLHDPPNERDIADDRPSSGNIQPWRELCGEDDEQLLEDLNAGRARPVVAQPVDKAARDVALRAG